MAPRISAALSRLALVSVLVPVAGILFPFSADAQQSAEGQRRLVVEQKIRLMESLLAAPRARQVEASGPAEAQTLFAGARRLLDAARGKLADKDYEGAGRFLDEALRAVSSGSSVLHRDGSVLSEGAHRAQNTELLEQLQIYRASLVEAAGVPESKIVSAAVVRLDQMAAKAQELMQAGRHGEANQILGETYRHAVTALSQARAGQTVILELKFASPADEFAYERKRNHGHEMLANMILEEDRFQDTTRDKVVHYLDENRKLRDRAEEEAAGGDYKNAIRTMESATGQLTQALRVVGVPVF